jgi:hypothetical protein
MTHCKHRRRRAAAPGFRLFAKIHASRVVRRNMGDPATPLTRKRFVSLLLLSREILIVLPLSTSANNDTTYANQNDQKNFSLSADRTHPEVQQGSRLTTACVVVPKSARV